MKKIQLSENLTLDSVQENNVQGNKLLAVVCYFTFFGKDGIAYISTDKLESKYESYGMREICNELSESFFDMLEENWTKVSKECKKYVKQWKKENAPSID